MYFNYEIEKITPINISDMDYNRNDIPDNVRKSITLYNRAIINLKRNCADLAIGDLKKALSFNSGFCEAIKLLGLSYVYINDFDKAEYEFKKLSKYNIYSMVANEYLKQLNVEKTASKAFNTIKNAGSNSNVNNKRNAIPKLPTQKGRIKRFTIAFSILTVITVSGLVIKSNPNIRTALNKFQNLESKKDNNAEKQKVKSGQYTPTDLEKKEVQKNLDNGKSALDNYKNKESIVLKLDNAEKLYTEGKYEDAAGILVPLKALTLDDMEKSRFDKLSNNIKANYIWNIYNEGNKLYKQGKYQEALPKLIIVKELAPDLEIMPWVIYQTAMCYKETNDNKNALMLFEKVKTSYPNSEYAGYSESKISEINGKLN